MKAVHNLRRHGMRSAAIFALPAIVAALGTVGFVAPPAISLHDARLRLEDLTGEAARLEHVAREWAELERTGAPDRTELAFTRLADLVPQGLPALELHGLVRATGEAVGMRLESLTVGEWIDPGLARVGDFVGARRVSLRGSGGPHHLVRLVEALRRVGFPVAVAGFQISRDENRPGYTLQLEFDVFERTHAPAQDEGPAGMEDIPS